MVQVKVGPILDRLGNQRKVVTVVPSAEIDVSPRKKSGRRTKLVRMDAPIVTKAQRIADDRGVPLSDYLSDLVRGSVDRDWAKMMKKFDQQLSKGDEGSDE